MPPRCHCPCPRLLQIHCPCPCLLHRPPPLVSFNIVAATDVVVYTLWRPHFMTVLQHYPAAETAVQAIVRACRPARRVA